MITGLLVIESRVMCFFYHGNHDTTTRIAGLLVYDFRANNNFKVLSNVFETADEPCKRNSGAQQFFSSEFGVKMKKKNVFFPKRT